MTAPFLLEIGVEEIPDWMIESALADLSRLVSTMLEEERLGGAITAAHATPRRLVLTAQGLLTQQADRDELVLGPPKSAAFKDGQLTGAGLGFAKKMGVSPDAVSFTTTDKGEYLSVTRRVAGRPALAILTERLPQLIFSIPWPKAMAWTGKGGPRFIRPIRWIVALLNDQVVPFQAADVTSGNTTRGHRQLGRPDVPVTIESHEAELWRNGVLLKASSRRERIEKGIHDLLSDKCMAVVPDPGLLDTLVYLTEYPTAILGFFDEKFLALPREVLIEVMRKHQRYFSVVNAQGKLMPMFIAITNTDGDPQGFIRRGHERVLKARFQDAQFFYGFDQQKPLRHRLEDLKAVTFQAKLGSYFEKVERMRALAAELGTAFDPEDAAAATAAAPLSKCDLTCEMVKEFTDLQGLIGGIYARVQGESEPVAQAIYEHYLPLSMDGPVPRSKPGQLLAIADKADTLRECFRIGLVPTGSKDPFALRRAAQGLVKILAEGNIALPVTAVLGENPELLSFFEDRLRYYFRDVKGFAYDEVNAVLAAPWSTVPDLESRLDAIRAVRPTPDFEPIAASLKRIRNILKQAGFQPSGPVNESLLEPGAERELYDAFLHARIAERRQNRDYISALAALAQLRPAVDDFFSKVLVNAPDAAVRANRLTLLNTILEEPSTIAGFSELVTN